MRETPSDKETAVAVTFDSDTRRLLDGRNFASVATINPDGGPQSPTPSHSVEIRGVAELVEDVDKALPAALSRKYLGQDPQPEPDDVVRLTVRVTPRKVNTFSV